MLTPLACRIMAFDIKNRIPPDFKSDFYFRFFTSIRVLRIASSRVELFINKIVSREERWSLCTLVSLPCYKQLLLVLSFFFFFRGIREKELYGIFTITLRFMQIRIFILFLFFFYLWIKDWGFVSLFQYSNE